MIIRNLFSAMAQLILFVCLMSVNINAQSINEIEIRDFPSQPDELTVPLGTKVIWVNDDTTDHTVTSDGGIFHSGYLAPGEQFDYIFDRPGNYPYHCDIHTSEQGMIRVTSEPYTSLFTSSGASTAPQRAQSDQSISETASTAHITTPQSQAYATQVEGKGNALWIQGTTGLTQYATVPLGERLSLMAIALKEGNGYLYEKHPDGQVTKNDHYFYPSSQIGFYADTIGQHVLSFSMYDQVSNSIVVDVIDRNAPSHKESSYKQQGYVETGYKQQSYQEPSYRKQGYQEPGYQKQLVSSEKGPSADYDSFWEKSVVKMDSSGRLTCKGLQGKEYNLQPSSANLLTRGLFDNGVSYILVANPSSISNTVLVNPQISNWDMPNVQVMYGNLMTAKMENLLQITAPAYQSGMIIIQPTVQQKIQPQRIQKKRYSFSIGPKPPSSFKVGPKPAYSSTGGVKQPYSFCAGPKQPYSFRIGY